jgi:hypothetical protein
VSLERGTKPHRASNATRVSLVLLNRFIDSRPMLTIVPPAALVRWHRQTGGQVQRRDRLGGLIHEDTVAA